MKLIITVIAVTFLAQGLQAASIGFDATNQDELTKSAEKTLKANDHQKSLKCPSQSNLLNYVKQLILDINLDLSKFNQTKFQKYAEKLNTLAGQTVDLEKQVEEADPKNRFLFQTLLQQYYKLRKEFLEDHKALPYIQRIEALEKIVEQLSKRIDTDVLKLNEKKLDSLVKDLTNDKENLKKMLDDLKNETDLKELINKTRALQNYEQSLQKRLDEIENKIIGPTL